MNPKRMSYAAGLLAGLMLAQPALAIKKAPAAAAQASAPETPKEVELVYALEADQAGALQQLVDRFNETSKGSRVVLSQRDWNTGKLPLLLFLDGKEGNRFLVGKPRYRPLWQAMKEARQPLAQGKVPAQMSPSAVDGAGHLLGLPALGTPVMFYNKNAFRKAGLDPDHPPRSWSELQDTLGTLRDKGSACPYTSSAPRWIHVENTDAWHDNAFASGGAKETGLAINDLLMIKHLAMMTTWVKSRYLHLFGRGREADGHFANGECAIITTSSMAYPGFQRRASFEVGVASLPYHDDIAGAPRHTLADGSVLWLGQGHTAAEYTLAARFVHFLLTPEAQADWQQKLGYLPLGRTGLPMLSTKEATDGPIQNRVAIADLDHKPATAASRATRLALRPDIQDIVDGELEALWAEKKPAKAAVDDAVSLARSALARKP
ncbi:MAG: extracellular solute-binding protein [Rhodocyclaceae bacterium]|nr:extracellular solute-binding protein [Rhodocyclaceae bacterium]